jgi:thiamine biosynthesis lipoprotein
MITVAMVMDESMREKHKRFEFNHKAMNTRFAIFILHNDGRYAEQAAAEAFRRLGGIEQEFSRFIDNSDVSRINRAQPDRPVQLGLDTFDCLTKALHLSSITNGAFDITAMKDRPSIPSWRSIALDASGYTARKMADNVRIDLGGIGKGFAVDAMAALLSEWELETVLIHGGASTALAIQGPPGKPGWKVTMSCPGTTEDSRRIIKSLYLYRRALSGSGIEKGMHIIDPRSGRPVSNRPASWALAPDATTADALSTAFMVMTAEEINSFCFKYSRVSGILMCHMASHWRSFIPHSPGSPMRRLRNHLPGQGVSLIPS